MIRKLFYIVCAWLIGIAAVALYLNHFDWNRARPYLAKYSKRFLGREIRVDGDLSLHLGVHPILVADGVSYENAAWAGEEPAFRAGHLEVKMDVWPAFKDVLQIPYVRLRDARLVVVTRPDGSNNLAPEAKDGGSTKAEKSKPLDLRLLEVDLANVVISYEKTAKIAIQRLVATQVGAGDLQVEGKAHVNELPASIEGTARDYLRAFRGGSPFDFVAMAHLGEMAARADGRIKRLEGLGGLAVDINVNGRNAQNVAKAFGLVFNDTVPPLDLTARVKHDGDTWEVGKAALHLGESRATGSVAVTLKTPPRIVATVHAPVLRFADLGALLPRSAAKELPSARKEEARRAGQPVKLFSDTPFPLDSLNNLDMDVAFVVDAFTGDGKAAVVKAFRGRFEAKGGKLAVRPLDADVAGGHVHTETSFDASAKPAVISTRFDVTNVEIGHLLQPYFVSDELKEKRVGKLRTDELFTGRLNGRIALEAKGNSIRQVMAGLGGEFGLALENGRMSSLLIEALGMDVTEAVGALAAKKQTVSMPCLITSLDAKAGQVKTRAMIASTSDSDVVIDGKLDLQAEQMDATITTHPKDFSIGAFRTPITLKGPLYKVHVDVVRQQLATRLLAAVGLGVFVNPVAALLPLIEPGLAKDGACERYIGEIKRLEAH